MKNYTVQLITESAVIIFVVTDYLPDVDETEDVLEENLCKLACEGFNDYYGFDLTKFVSDIMYEEC
jgi:hypothetical protein